jgi:hypothetical protein
MTTARDVLAGIKARNDLSWLPASERARYRDSAIPLVLSSDVPRLLAAVEVVLEMCDRAHEARRRFPLRPNDTRPIYLEVEQIEAAITAALEKE